MFAVLRVKSLSATGIIGRLLHKIKKHSVKAELVKTPLGSYLLLEAESESINWKKVENLCGRAGKRLVMPPELELPQVTTLKRFVPEALTGRIMLNTCTEVIRRCHLPLYRKIVTLVDINAEYTYYVPELLCNCITVRVVTACDDRYDEVSRQMMEELGASVLVTNTLGEPQEQGDSIFIICPNGNAASTILSKTPVFTLGNIDVPAPSKLIGDLQIKPQGQLAELLPHGIAAIDFAGAMYDYFGWQGGKKLLASTLRCKGNLLQQCDIIEYLEQYHHNTAYFASF